MTRAFRYASFIELKSVPEPFAESLDGKSPDLPPPMLAEVEGLKSIARILLPLSLREGTLFPLWHFMRGKKHIIGTCIPFEHYYEADALPVFFYVSQDEAPEKGFIKYIAVKPAGERVEYSNNTSDAKFFYAETRRREGHANIPQVIGLFCRFCEPRSHLPPTDGGPGSSWREDIACYGVRRHIARDWPF